MKVATSADWTANLRGIEILSKDVLGVVLAATPGMDTQAVLRQAMAAGEVEHFGFESGGLAELYRELVVN